MAAQGLNVTRLSAAAAEQMSGGNKGMERARIGTETKGQEGEDPDPSSLPPRPCIFAAALTHEEQQPDRNHPVLLRGEEPPLQPPHTSPREGPSAPGRPTALPGSRLGVKSHCLLFGTSSIIPFLGS